MQRYNLNKRFLVWLLLLLSSLSQAQVLQWSQPIRLRGAAQFTKVLGENEHGVYLLRYRNQLLSKKILIDRYHHHLKLNYSRSIDLHKGRLVKIKMLKEHILVVYAKFDRSSQSNLLYAQYYNYELKAEGEWKVIQVVPLQEFGDRGDFRIRVSDSEAYIAVIYTQKDGSHAMRYHWTVYDKSLNIQHTAEQHFPIPRKYFMTMNLMVSDSGMIYSILREIKDDRHPKRNHADYIMVHYQDTVLSHPILDSLVIHNIAMSYDRFHNEIVIAGFYGELGQYGSEGVMVYRYGVDQQHFKTQLTPFDTSLTGEMALGKHRAHILPEGFDFLKLIPRSDGGLMLVAEQKEIDTENDIIMVHGIPTSTSKNVYNFNEIVALNLNAQGEVEWQHVIHKNQTTINDGGYFSSAIVFVDDHFIQVIYNEQIRNSGEVMQYTLFSNGKISSRKLLKSEIDDVVVIPFESQQVASNKIIIPTSKNRRFALLKLVYD